jgi:uncharacterized protein (TIGR03435 family)
MMAARRRNSSNGALRRIEVGVLCSLLMSLYAAFAQTGPESPMFEVVSVHPGKSGGEPRMAPSPGGLVAENVTARMLIRAAYRMDESSMLGGPGWLDAARYNVAAKTSRAASQDLLRLMLQRLLADRFQLKVHRDTRQGQAYALMVADKKGPMLHPADSARCAVATAIPCGRTLKPSQGPITGEGVSMQEFARFLTGLAGLPVLDHTGLSGIFDITLRVSSANDAANAGNGKETPDSSPDGRAAALATALREQLGLRLEPARGPVELLVIDSVKRPSEN